ncbi:hypothetical protein [Nitrobacter winogradskyi]|uniref:AlkP superfamily phosphohydrolase/phosphomutase n=2 Tax=Nitrobacter winogradskyi TaxID=913 RepID=A0ACC6AF64_NITWI|nr:hypothetical protein [Nitrobacter winogradskyi]MCP1998153.1 putative AlkP superfamily phosphohydrolase/phosphomutase [Nitrobacter winogradskyi]GEC15253.1 hypothetical protein NWI01_11450 [Nitrobacter winogradskyi]
MIDRKELKARMAGETRVRMAAEERERLAIVRAERAEQSERNLTAELDRAHRLIDRLRAQIASMGCTVV